MVVNSISPAQITGPGAAELVSYGERVAVVNAVVTRIAAQVGLK